MEGQAPASSSEESSEGCAPDHRGLWPKACCQEGLLGLPQGKGWGGGSVSSSSSWFALISTAKSVQRRHESVLPQLHPGAEDLGGNDSHQLGMREALAGAK